MFLAVSTEFFRAEPFRQARVEAIISQSKTMPKFLKDTQS